MASAEKRWIALNKLVMRCDCYSTPQWTEESNRRKNPLNGWLSDIQMMEIIAMGIACSQNARSKQVSELIRSGVFASAFADFDIAQLSKLDPEMIVQCNWRELGSIRFKGKVQRIVECARVVKKIALEFGSFAQYVDSFGIPRSIRTEADLDMFWDKFHSLRRDLRERELPFFHSTTSLLQVPLSLGYDSVKPDLIVMRFARRIGLVTGDANLRSVVRQIQTYALEPGLRGALVDLAILAFSGQTDARNLLRQRFCPSSDPCRHKACELGQNSLCIAFKQ